MKVVILNAVLSNAGDGAIVEGLIASLVQVGAAHPRDITVFDSNGEVTALLYPHLSIAQQPSYAPGSSSGIGRALSNRIRMGIARLVGLRPSLALRLARAGTLPAAWRRFLVAIHDCDVVISTGGTYLVDHYDFSRRITDLLTARRLGKKVVLWTQSLGPFTESRARRSIGRLRGQIDAVYLRDERSLRAWEACLGSHPPAEVVPDVAFALEASPQSDAGTEMGRAVISMGRAVISVREWGRGVETARLAVEPYRATMRAAVEEVAGRGLDPTALSTCQGVPSYRYDDSAVARDFFAGLPVQIDSAFRTPDQLMNELARSQIVVTTRMHLAILAIVCRRPVIAVAYEFKTLELFESLGLGANVVRIEDASPEWIRDRIAAVLDDPSSAILDPDRIDEVRAGAMHPARQLALWAKTT